MIKITLETINAGFGLDSSPQLTSLSRALEFGFDIYSVTKTKQNSQSKTKTQTKVILFQNNQNSSYSFAASYNQI